MIVPPPDRWLPLTKGGCSGVPASQPGVITWRDCRGHVRSGAGIMALFAVGEIFDAEREIGRVASRSIHFGM